MPIGAIMRNIFLIIARFTAVKLLPRIPYPVLKGPLGGMKIIHGSFGGPSGGALVYFNLYEQKQTEEFLNHIEEGNIVFDIGANVGYYTLLSSRNIGVKGKVFSFEPLVRNLSYLYRHVELNKLENVIILPVACSESSSFTTFSFGRNEAQGYLVKNNWKGNFSFQLHTYVQTISIDEFVRNSGYIPHILKIDVEGAELLVLKGAKETFSSTKPKIFLSIHTAELEKKCIEYLKDFGYKFILLDEKERPSVEYLCL